MISVCNLILIVSYSELIPSLSYVHIWEHKLNSIIFLLWLHIFIQLYSLKDCIVIGLALISSGYLNIVADVEITKLIRGTEGDPLRKSHIFPQIFSKIQISKTNLNFIFFHFFISKTKKNDLCSPLNPDRMGDLEVLHPLRPVHCQVC